MSTLADYLLFKRFITPAALQLLFWSAIGGTLYGSWWLFAHDNWAWMIALPFGTLVSRLIFESLLVRYRSYLCLTQIRDILERPVNE